jgi:hypothetical protein
MCRDADHVLAPQLQSETVHSGTNEGLVPLAVTGTADGRSFDPRKKGVNAMANTTQPSGKSMQGGMPSTHDAGKGMMDKARDMASDVADKAKDVAGNIGDKARDLADKAGDRAENLTHRAGSGIESLGHAVRDNLPHGGTVGAVADRAAGGLESAGRYIQDEGLSGMADDFTDMIRRNPIPAVLIGVGLGYMIARACRS